LIQPIPAGDRGELPTERVHILEWSLTGW
jgi:hypothetical protein